MCPSVFKSLHTRSSLVAIQASALHRGIMHGGQHVYSTLATLTTKLNIEESHAIHILKNFFVKSIEIFMACQRIKPPLRSSIEVSHDS